MSPIDEIKEKLDIADVIAAAGVSLRKTGRSFVGFCPFHPNSRTPAFTVYPDTQSFYCFGCHASGTVFDFVMRKEGLDFRAALEQLALRAGVTLQPRSDEEQQIDQQRTRLLEINAAAARYFNYVLLSLARGEPGRAYVERRGLDPPTVEAFQLGYSLDDWGHLFNYLTERKGYQAEEVEAAGLAIRGETRGWYDRFRGRLIFPIRNPRGEVVGFGGRALGDVPPKYLNTPETLLFKKGELLYGLDLARDAIRSADATVVVEGYVDVISAHQYGFRNIVAPLGTALTRGHVAALKKLSHNVYLALDADAAGQKATLRGLSALRDTADEEGGQLVTTAQGAVRLQSDVSLRIIRLPEGQDPDEVIKADPERWRALVAEAAPVMDFYLDALTAGLDLSRAEDQSTALDRLLPLVAELDGAQQRVYIARLEQLIGLRAELIIDLLRGKPGRTRGPTTSTRPGERRLAAAPAPSAADDRARSSVPPRASREEYLLALALRYPAVAPAIEQLLAQDAAPFPACRALLGDALDQLLERPEHRAIWQAWSALDPGERPDEHAALEAWADALGEPLALPARAMLALPLPRQADYLFRQDAEKCARHLRQEQIRNLKLRLTRQAHDSEEADEKQRLLALSNVLDEYFNALNRPRRGTTYNDLRDTLGKD